MFQDVNGYLWSGGYGGLSRFDGKSFVNYNRKNGLVDHNVNVIAGDGEGVIFVGTNKGLSVFGKDRKFSNYGRNEGLATPYVTALCRGYHHAMYIGTTRGMFMYKDKKIRPVKKLENAVINYLYNPDTSVIFIGTEKGLVIYGHNTFRILDESTGLISNRVNCITRFLDELAIGTDKGLSFYNLKTGKVTNYTIETGLIDEQISALNNQNNQYLWVGSPSGLLRFTNSKFEYYNIGQDNNSNQVRCVLNDREDNIWVGTHSGLYRYRDNSFSTFERVPGLATSFIFQIFRDRNGELWVTSQNSGIYRETQSYFKHYTIRNGLNTNIIRSGLEDHEGRLIFGTAIDLTRFNNERFETIPLPQKLMGAFDVVYLDSKNVLWIGGRNGIASLQWKDNRPETKFYPIYTRADFAVYGFCEDDNRNLYIGTHRAGLFRLENDSLVNISTPWNLNEETFFTLKYAKGNIFAASLNGLLVLDVNTKKLRRITDTDGLNSELVYSIEFAEDKKALWIGTNQGINKLNLRKYLATGEIVLTSYGKKEGFAGVECNSNGIWEDRNGTVWFGTVSGLIKHEPFHLKKNLVENKTLIQNINLMNEDTLLRDSVVLPSDHNSISFYYRGICLTNPERVLYQRKLEGLDADWSAPSNEDYIKYTNLPPGKYTFRVRSSNNEGIWNENETTFTFRIKSPFYLTWWFLLISLVCVIALIYLLFIIRIYTIKKRQRLDFERKVEMSKIELKALRTQMNPHFVFNSLNAIQHYIFNTKSEEAIKYLNKFARLVRIILNNSEKPTVTVGEDLEALKLYLELEQMRFEEKFEYEIIIDESVDPDYDIMPPLLMQPYVENAILHGLNPKPVKGKLTIRLYSKNNFLICTITDNGIGREKAAEIRRTMPIKNHKSMGMKITEDRLRILNEINNSHLSVSISDLKDDDGKSTGTRVDLFVPLNG